MLGATSKQESKRSMHWSFWIPYENLDSPVNKL